MGGCHNEKSISNIINCAKGRLAGAVANALGDVVELIAAGDRSRVVAHRTAGMGAGSGVAHRNGKVAHIVAGVHRGSKVPSVLIAAHNAAGVDLGHEFGRNGDGHTAGIVGVLDGATFIAANHAAGVEVGDDFRGGGGIDRARVEAGNHTTGNAA